MRQDIVHYDRRGIVPSRSVRTLEEYLYEAERKARVLDSFERDPEKTVAEMTGIRAKAALLRPSSKDRTRYQRRFLTEPRPALHADPAAFKQLMQAKSARDRGKYHIANVFGTVNGTTILLEEDPSLTVPVLKLKQSDSRDEGSRRLLHESVHCVRDQRRGAWDDFGYGMSEETMAYYSDRSQQESMDAAVSYTVLVHAIKLAPLAIAGALLISPYTLAMPAALIANTAYHARRASSLYQRCAAERINPYYVFLRADPSEFSNAPIRDQIAASSDTRFQIMAQRLGLK